MQSEKQILLNRAKNCAGRREFGKSFAEETVSVIEFRLIPEIYAIEEQFISEVFTLNNITVIPGTPGYVMGVINLRGRIVSIINLKSLFNLKERGLTELNKVLILKNDKMMFGIVADSIIGNKNIIINSLSQAPLTLGKTEAEYISGISPEGLIILNAPLLLSGKFF